VHFTLKQDLDGKEAVTVYCSSCGKETPDGATFCLHCGAKIFLPERANAAAASANPSPARSEESVDNEYCERYEKILTPIKGLIEKIASTRWGRKRNVTDTLNKGSSMRSRRPLLSGAGAREESLKREYDLYADVCGRYEKDHLFSPDELDVVDTFRSAAYDLAFLGAWRREANGNLEGAAESIENSIRIRENSAEDEEEKRLIENLRKKGARLWFASADKLMQEGNEIQAEAARERGNRLLAD